MKNIYIDTYQIHSNTNGMALGRVIHSMEGVGFPEMRMSEYNRPGEFGGIVSNLLYGGRSITISGSIFADNIVVFEQRRREFEKMIRIVRNNNAVSLPAVMKLTTMDDLLLQANVYVKEFVMDVNQPLNAEYLLTLYAPDYAFYSQNNKVEAISRASGGGLVYPAVYPAIYGEAEGGQITINHECTVETFPTIYLNGPLNTPIIQNLTLNRTIGLNLTLSATDQIIINTKERTIIKNGNQSVLQNKTSGTKFWWLTLGNNVIRFFSGSAGDIGNAQIHYRDAYLGI